MSNEVKNFAQPGNNKSYEIKDLTGKVIAKGMLTASQTTFDLSEHSAGIYIFELSEGERVNHRQKIIKE